MKKKTRAFPRVDLNVELSNPKNLRHLLKIVNYCRRNPLVSLEFPARGGGTIGWCRDRPPTARFKRSIVVQMDCFFNVRKIF